MAYSTDFSKAARRHLDAAGRLDAAEPARVMRSVAGYLFGIAAECALKQMMRDSGMRPLADEERRNDPFWAHFPEIKTLLRDRIYGRRAGELRRFVEDGSFMNHWDVRMRYAPAADISAEHIDRWRQQAAEVVAAMT